MNASLSEWWWSWCALETVKIFGLTVASIICVSKSCSLLHLTFRQKSHPALLYSVHYLDRTSSLVLKQSWFSTNLTIYVGLGASFRHFWQWLLSFVFAFWASGSKNAPHHNLFQMFVRSLILEHQRSFLGEYIFSRILANIMLILLFCSAAVYIERRLHCTNRYLTDTFLPKTSELEAAPVLFNQG